MNEEAKKWKKLKRIHLGHPCHDCEVLATRENFQGRDCAWHWKRIADGQVAKICTSCSGKRGIPVPIWSDLFHI